MESAHRSPSLAKGDWGKLLILGGSAQLAGALVLNTHGALRTGVDLVVVAAPDRASTAVLHHHPDAVTISLPTRHFEPKYMRFMNQFRHYTVVLGSGITSQKAVVKFVHKVLHSFTGPFVLDADAVRIVAASRTPARLWSGKQVLLTPNRAEYASLIKKRDDHPLNTISELANRLRATVLCKGPVDVLSDGRQTVEIPGGSEYLAKAGTGDVLSGVVGALVARGNSLFEAAREGTRLINEASMRAEALHGAGLMATDIAEQINAGKPPPTTQNRKGRSS